MPDETKVDHASDSSSTAVVDQPAPVETEEVDSPPRSAAEAGVKLQSDSERAAAEAESDRKQREAFEKLSGEKIKGDDTDDELEALGKEQPAETKPEPETKSQLATNAKDANKPDEAAIRKAWIRDNTDPDEIENIRKALGEEKFLAMTLPKIKRQADYDKKFGNKTDEAKASPDNSASATNAVAPQPGDPRPLEAISDELDQAFDPDTATKLKGDYKALQERLASNAATAQALQETVARDRWDRVKAELQSSFPSLSDPEVQDKLGAQVLALDGQRGTVLRDYNEFRQLVEKAAYVVLGPRIAAETRAAVMSQNKAVRAGQPDLANKPTGSNRALTADEADAMILRVLEKYGSDKKVADSKIAEIKARATKYKAR